MDSEFSGKVVVVVGASSGIGRATAEMFAESGARVAIFARSREKLNKIAGKRMLAVSGDAAREQDIARLFTECESRFGACNILVNSAGMVDPERLVKTTLRRWDRLFAVNVRSMFLS